MFQIATAVVMVVVAFALVYAIRQYMAAQSERRMRTMLIKIGLDPTIVSSGDSDVIMREIRQRCRTCNSEDTCERWLAGEEPGENVFCPNAQVFESMKKTMGDRMLSQGL
jgi:hypothetical protein